MFSTPKGKAPTKGARQILHENNATVKFYRNMALGATFIHFVVPIVFTWDDMTYAKLFNVLVFAIYIGSYQLMKYISRPHYLQDGQLLDPGLDLNMEGGMGEHVKDVVICTSITHVLASWSSYFWLLLLLLPLRALWLLWVNILGPWFFQEAPEETEKDEKKKRKLQRKMKNN